MPDRYLVTHTLIKDVTNEDLKDFLQESIEECFQILDNGKGITYIIIDYTRETNFHYKPETDLLTGKTNKILYVSFTKNILFS